MDFGSISKIAASGMAFERARVENATLMLSLANVAFESQSKAIDFANEIGVANLEGVGSESSGVEIKETIEPSNPLAGPDGRVFYIDVDPVMEMATLVAASRAYEANIRAYNINSKMTANALNIGGGNK